MSNNREAPGRSMKESERAFLQELLDARLLALELERDRWQFAIEVERAAKLGVPNSVLRQWMARSIVEAGFETTPDNASERTFRRHDGLAISRATCIVLSASGCHWCTTNGNHTLTTTTETSAEGADETQRLPDHTSEPVPDVAIQAVAVEQAHTVSPQWDPELRELRMGVQLVKQFRVPAPNQELILCAFAEEQWPARIDDPLPRVPHIDAKRRLQATIVCLNRSQVAPAIRFRGDGTGTGIRWETRTKT